MNKLLLGIDQSHHPRGWISFNRYNLHIAVWCHYVTDLLIRVTLVSLNFEWDFVFLGKLRVDREFPRASWSRRLSLLSKIFLPLLTIAKLFSNSWCVLGLSWFWWVLPYHTAFSTSLLSTLLIKRQLQKVLVRLLILHFLSFLRSVPPSETTMRDCIFNFHEVEHGLLVVSGKLLGEGF